MVIKKKDIMSERGGEIIDSTEVSDPGHAPGPFASLPSPIHPSICPPPTHLPSHPSCPAGQALPSICCLSQLGAALFPPPLAFTIQLKATTPSSSSLSSSSSFPPTPPPHLFFFLAVPGWAQQKGPIPHVGSAIMTHTYQAYGWCKHTLTHRYTECVQKSKRKEHKEMNTLTTHNIFFFILILT